MLPTLLSALAGLCLLTPVSARQQNERQKIIDSYPDGKPMRVYFVDSKGMKQGLMEELSPTGRRLARIYFKDDDYHGRHELFHPNGKIKSRGQYKKGRRVGLWIQFDQNGKRSIYSRYRLGSLHGRYQEFHPSGLKRVLARYKDGKLDGKHERFSADQSLYQLTEYKLGKRHGTLRITKDQRLLWQQTWQEGDILTLNGNRVHPVAANVLRRTIKEILTPPAKPAGPAKPDKQRAARLSALRRLKAYRYLCRVPYQDLQLHEPWNAQCDLAAEVCARNGSLSHFPPMPEGMDPERYKIGYEAAGKSNLSKGRSIPASVDAYMDDSDRRNIDKVGHRRWCLNPPMRRTGFGGYGDSSAMWAMDRSGDGPGRLTAVCFPPAGYVPVDMFGHH